MKAIALFILYTTFLSRVVIAEETQLFWGDTHVHSSYSSDSYAFGNTTIDPDKAFKFAAGIGVIHPGTGALVRINRPLDFLVVADHVELLGSAARAASGDRDVLSTKAGRLLRSLIDSGDSIGVWQFLRRALSNGSPDEAMELSSPNLLQAAWEKSVDFADQNYKPHQFSTFAGWEWTSLTPEGFDGPHRVIFTTAGGEKAKSFLPFSAFDSKHPEELWKFLSDTAKSTGEDFIAIPHNLNRSNGKAFSLKDSLGEDISFDYAKARGQWERVVEVSQTKGTSETSSLLSPLDQFADFELLKQGTFSDASKAGSFARHGLLRGLLMTDKINENPFKFGMIGSTDTHTGLSSVDETLFLGALPVWAKPAANSEPFANVKWGGRAAIGWDFSASGLAGVWAESNTRQSILSAFRRREVYATTGPRIKLRFFGGFSFKENDVNKPDYAEFAYANGVPMGGTLSSLELNPQAPSFLIHAVKDPEGNNLDRIQVVKGWVDSKGVSHERIYDVFISNQTDIGSDKANTSFGAKPLASLVGRSRGEIDIPKYWSDPEFNPTQDSFYYIRVLEVPSPRWSSHEARSLGRLPSTTGHPELISERAFSSPIWYEPASNNQAAMTGSISSY